LILFHMKKNYERLGQLCRFRETKVARRSYRFFCWQWMLGG
jgi:hypothetical protein